TPALANGGTSRGSEIACFLPNIDDSRESLNEHFVEVNWLSSNGGGVGGNWSGIRSNGAKTSKGSSSNGAIPFMGILDRAVLAFAQGGTRRASYAAYMAASHPEVQEFIDMRRPTGGDLNRKNLNLHHGVSLSDEFMRAVK
ncbi:ribonucleotide-diphosphate reductase subunit alpha, partial [Bacillus mycoides]